MTDIDVAIVGAGPTGLALACELGTGRSQLCGVSSGAPTEPNLTRAFAVHARTLELLDARGLADGSCRAACRCTRVSPAPGATPRSRRSSPSRYPMVLIVPQSGTEQLLEERAARARRARSSAGAEVVGLAPGRRRGAARAAGPGRAAHGDGGLRRRHATARTARCAG